MTAAWFDPLRFGALYGGLVGGGLGMAAIILGAATAVLAPQGKHRRFILGAFKFMLLVGVAHLAIGLYAVYQQQPFGIWYPLLFIGCLFTFLFSLLHPIVRKNYEQAESRKMDAMALRRV